ncbi:phytase [Sphingobacterium oryzagri]|uniref:Phytase n=1 Tax=Sphingobacterium oryzagri TaxID=3025669 RepID=A0ABY7WFL1_9SPHI|nr:phytase [Sphingobacterium sp. KACC 22765]WDF67316.1 phytase [Sphingobacterium sp. KACC 22765]
MNNILRYSCLVFSVSACISSADKLAAVHPNAIKPSVITQQVAFDTDDPAIWIHPTDSSSSLVIGTDKNEAGALFVFDLEGKVVKKSIPLNRPNNVDIVQGFLINGKRMDIAVTTERGTNMIRVFSLPDLEVIDGGGIPVFEGEKERSPMGISLYTRPADKAVFAIVGRKNGPADRYLWQYQLQGNADGTISAKKVRSFGKFSGKKEIEAITVDNELGYVYYSDEQTGIRKYYADPAQHSDAELSLFAQHGFVSDHEGLAIYKTAPDAGYIVASNQQNNSIMLYPRQGNPDAPHQHELIAEIPISAVECDGLEITTINLGQRFPKGMLVAMSNGKVFHYYDWREIDQRLKK